MLLGLPQKKLLKILKEFGCLMERQLEMLLKEKFKDIRLEFATKQLCYYGLISINGEYIALKDKTPDSRIIQAVDVMLSFPVKDIEVYKLSKEPFILTFYKNNREGILFRYDICKCDVGKESLLSAQLSGIPSDCRAFIVILSELSQEKKLKILQNHFFAVRENENYQFYIGRSEYES